MPDSLVLEIAEPEIAQPENACSRKKRRKKKVRKGTCTGFLTYLRIAWVDLLCIAVVLGLSIGIYFAPISFYSSRVIPMWPTVLSINTTDAAHDIRAPVEFSYPFKRPFLDDFSCAGVVTGAPLLVFAIFQIRTRSLWDFHAGALGVLKGIVATTFVCIILKQSIGGFRPHFLDLCKPNMTLVFNATDQSTYWLSPPACTGNARRIKTALQSFPSGHTASTFAAAIFVTLYLNAKLKIFADHSPDFWAFIVAIVPLIGASIVSGSMYLSHHHHVLDIVFGMIIGLSLGTAAYRSSYAAIFDFHYNHIPLPPFGTRARFSYNRDLINQHGPTKRAREEVDKLVVWSWWTQSGPKDVGRDKESLWFRNIRNVHATGYELRSLWPPLTIPRAARQEDNEPQSLDGVWDLDV